MKLFGMLVTAFALVPGLPGTSTAASIVVTYDITSGNTYGGFLGNAPIQGGTAIVTMPWTPLSAPLNFTTGTIYLKLTATNSQTFKRTFIGIGNFVRGPAKTLSAGYITGPVTVLGSAYTAVRIAANSLGSITVGQHSVGSYFLITTTFGSIYSIQSTHYGVYLIKGQEVPEPAAPSLLGTAIAGLVALMVVPAALSRTRRRRASDCGR